MIDDVCTKHFVFASYSFVCFDTVPLYLYHVNMSKSKTLSLIIRHYHSNTIVLASFSFGTSVCQWTSGPVGGNGTPGFSLDTWRESRVLRSRAKSSSFPENRLMHRSSVHLRKSACILLSFAEILRLN